MADLNLNLKVSVGKGVQDINGVSAAIGKLDVEVTKASSSLTKIGEIFTGALAADLAAKGLSKLVDGFKEVIQFVGESIKEAEQYEQALQNLNVALSNSGNFSAQASKDFENFANEIERTTKFSDDAVLSAGALIEQLSGLSEKGLKTATTAAIELSAALGVDLESAARLVGKAAEGNVESLKKYGLEVQKGTDDAETFANALNLINSRFGGTAKDQINTYAGAVTLSQNAFRDLQKEIGNAFVKNVALVSVIKEVGKLFGDNADAVNKNQQALRELVAQGLINFIDALEVTNVSLDAIYRLLRVVTNAVTALFQTLALGANTIAQAFVEPLNLLGQLQEKITGTKNPFEELTASMRANSVALAQGINQDFEDISEAFQKPTQASEATSDALLKLRDSAEAGFAAVKSGALSSIDPLNNATAATMKLTAEQEKLLAKGRELASQAQEKALAEDPQAQAQAQIDAINFAAEQRAISEQDASVAREVARQEGNAKEAEQLLAQNETLRQLDEGANAERIAANQARIDQIVNQETLGSQKRQEIMLKEKQFEQKVQDQRLGALSSFFGGAAALARTAGKDGFEVAKRLAQAQATIDGYRAIQAALANPPGPPFNALIVAGVVAQTAANLINIERQQFAGGTNFVPGGGTRDSVPALLTPGERVVPRETNRDLTQFLRERKNGASDEALDAIRDLASQPISIHIDGKEIFNVVKNQMINGRVLA